MKGFQYYAPGRIHFGARGIEQIGAVVKAYSTRCLFVTTAMKPPLDKLFKRVIGLLEEAHIEVLHFDGAAANPDTDLIQRIKDYSSEHEYGVILAVGGGSTIDTAKMASLLTGKGPIQWPVLFSEHGSPFQQNGTANVGKVPVIAVPTTSGTGSQVTQCAVISEGNEKHDIFDGNMIPAECIIDPGLMCTLPAGVTAATGFDAFCHACESYLSPYSSPVTTLYSLKAMHLAAEYLPRAIQEPQQIEYRSFMALADLYAGLALSNAGGYVAHPICELLGTAGHMSHGQSLAVLFDFVMEKKWQCQVEKSAAAARILRPSLTGEADEAAACELPGAIREFLTKIGMDIHLSDFPEITPDIERVRKSPVLSKIPCTDELELLQILDIALQK